MEDLADGGLAALEQQKQQSGHSIGAGFQPSAAQSTRRRAMLAGIRPGCKPPSTAEGFPIIASELDLVSALEFQQAPRLGRRRSLKTKSLDDRAHFQHLLRIGRREFAAVYVQAVFEPHADV